ncbi:MAG: TonB-dependent receptor [Bacteroidia bacterium]|nr:TonB-dependent receptor [Bacteroidia bacterium]
MMNFRSRILLLLIFMPFMAFPQGTQFKGTIKDDHDWPVAGARVSVRNSALSTTTDSLGNFLLENIPVGTAELEITGASGFSKVEAVTVTATSESKTIILPEYPQEESRLGSDNLPVISLGDDDLRDAVSPNVASVLNASRDAFSSATAFVFSAARFRVRGYDDENFVSYMNGIPLNDLYTERNLYSSYSGLNDVMRNRDNSLGLAPATFAFGGVGGSSTVDSRASRQRKQFQVSYAASNRTYDNRLMLTYGSGLMKGGWSYALNYSRRWATDGYVDGTFYDGHSYFAALEKKINSRHSLALTIMGAKTKSGRTSAVVQEMYDLAGTHYYNPNWGYQNGEKRNSKVGDTHQPLAILTHEWKINDKSSLLSAVSYQTGYTEISGIDWYNATDPRPDYYRYLPSYDPNYGEDPASFAVYSSLLASLMRANEDLRQINWDRLYESNQLHDTTFNGVSGKWAKYILSDRVTDNTRICFNSTYSNVVSDHLTFNGGFTYQSQQSENYKEVKDLLGADFFVDLNQYTDLANPDSTDMQNDLNNPDRILHTGDKYGYDFTAHLQNASLWGQGTWKFSRMDYFLALQLTSSSYYRTGHYKNGVFPDNSYGNSEKQNFFNYAVKGGATFKYNGRNYFYGNAAYLTRAPLFENAYVSPRTRDFVVKNLKDESIYSGEAGYLLRSPKFKGRLTGYFTQFTDGTDTRSFYDEDYKTFVNYTLTGVDKRNTGVEISAEASLGKGFSASAVAAVGQYYYSSRPLATISQDNVDTLLFDGEVVYAKNMRVSSGPQSA